MLKIFRKISEKKRSGIKVRGKMSLLIRMTPFGILLLTFFLYTKQISRAPSFSFKRSNASPLSSYISKRNPASLLGLNVVIPEGEIAFLDESTNLDSLTVLGELHCDEETAEDIVELRVQKLMVQGLFQCGTPTNPYDKKLIISLKPDADINPKNSPIYRSIMAMGTGVISLHGNRSKAGWKKLAQTAMPGDNYIVIQSPLIIAEQPKKFLASAKSGVYNGSYRRNKSMVFKTERGALSLAGSRAKNIVAIQNPWKVGDRIAIGPTGYDYSEGEDFIITSIDSSNPYKLFLDHPIEHMHWGEREYFQTSSGGNYALDERAEVANLTRSIVIKADEASGEIDETDSPDGQLGGHFMVHSGAQAYIDSVEFYKLGQAGIMGRYPFHWHIAGDVSGQYIKNSSIHHSYQRCITIHRTHKALVRNNVCYDFKGHGYFLEDGDEVENEIIKNLAIMAKPPSPSKVLLFSDNVSELGTGSGRFPAVSSFWITHPFNTVKHNVASGSVGAGFWMSFVKEVKDGNTVVATPRTSLTKEFNYNTAHGTKVGFTWDGSQDGGSANNPNNPADKKINSSHYYPPEVPVFKGLKAYKSTWTGIYFRGQSAVFKNAVTADNGWSYWVSYNQIVRDSIMIGKTSNYSDEMRDFYFANASQSRYRRNGMVMYDGPFEIHNTEFLNFSTQTESYSFPNGQTYNSTVVPFTSTGGTNKYTNLVSGLSFSPEPIHRIHVESRDENPRSTQMLGTGSIRDLDGTFTNDGPGVVVAGRSLGITPSSGCEDGGEKFYNYKLCPEDYTEGAFYFMTWGTSQLSPWITPFNVRRSDNVYNYDQIEWGNYWNKPNNLFNTEKTGNYLYELMPYKQYAYHKEKNASPRVEFNHEFEEGESPIVKFHAYGNNCRLDDSEAQFDDYPELKPIEVQSLSELQSTEEHAYYTDGEDFYVRLANTIPLSRITDDPLVMGTGYYSKRRLKIVCDNEYLEKRIKGKITSVSYGETETEVKGWACNYTSTSKIRVNIYAKSNSESILLAGNVWSDVQSLPETAFDCGYANATKRDFNFSFPNNDISEYSQHRFHVEGLSNSGGEDEFITGSGWYRVTKPVYELPQDVKKN